MQGAELKIIQELNAERGNAPLGSVEHVVNRDGIKMDAWFRKGVCGWERMSIRRRAINEMRIREAAMVEIDSVESLSAEEPPPVSKYQCQKCGKEFKRGLHFHAKHCKG